MNNKLILILLLSLFIIPFVNAIGISTCTTLSSGSNILTQSLVASGTCLETFSHNVELDCRGYNVTYGTGSVESYGIDVIGARRNITIKNCRFFDGNSSTTIIRTGIRAYATTGQPNSNMTIFNNTIHTIGNNSYGIDLKSYNGTNVSWNNITTIGSTSYGIFLNISSENIIINNFINTSGNSDAYAVYFLNTQGNNFTYNILNTTGNVRPYGIFIDNSTRGLIGYNTIGTSQSATNGKAFAIYLNLGNNTNITNNRLNGEGGDDSSTIRITTSSSVDLYNNVIHTYATGTPAIQLELGSHTINLFNNIIRMDSTTDYHLFYTSASHIITLFNNTLTHNGEGDGIRIAGNVNGYNITNNNLIVNGVGDYGMNFDNIRTSTIQGNIANTTTSGLSVISVFGVGFNNINISYNNLSSSVTNAHVINLTNTQNLTIAYNFLVATGGGGNGITFTSLTNNNSNLSTNRIITGTGTGVNIVGVSGLTIERNSINSTGNNAESIEMSAGSVDNNITFNSISNLATGSGSGDMSITNSHNLIIFGNMIRNSGLGGSGIGLVSTVTNSNISNNDITITGGVSGVGTFAMRLSTGVTASGISGNIIYDNTFNSTNANTFIFTTDGGGTAVNNNFTDNRFYGNVSTSAVMLMEGNNSDNTFLNNNFTTSRNGRVIEDNGATTFLNYLIYNDSNAKVDFTGIRGNMTLYLINASTSFGLETTIRMPNNNLVEINHSAFRKTSENFDIILWQKSYEAITRYSVLYNDLLCDTPTCTKNRINPVNFSVQTPDLLFMNFTTITSGSQLQTFIKGSGGSGSTGTPIETDGLNVTTIIEEPAKLIKDIKKQFNLPKNLEDWFKSCISIDSTGMTDDGVNICPNTTLISFLFFGIVFIISLGGYYIFSKKKKFWEGIGISLVITVTLFILFVIFITTSTLNFLHINYLQ